MKTNRVEQGYKGVVWHKASGKWRAQIGNGRLVHLGTYAIETDAAYAYDAAALQLFGLFACLNFRNPEHPEVRFLFADTEPEPCIIPYLQASADDGSLPTASSSALPSEEKMARRKYQAPRPHLEGAWWYLRVWRDESTADGKTVKRRDRIKLAPASMPAREVRRVADEVLAPLNHGFITVGSAVLFIDYVEKTYTPTVFPLLAKTTRGSCKWVLNKYLLPQFGNASLRDLTPLVLQRYVSRLTAEGVSYPTLVKIRETLSSVLRLAAKYKFLHGNPAEDLELPPDKRGKRKKPVITPEEFDRLVALIPEPYATMVYTAVWTGLRVSELNALRWESVNRDSITIAQRFTRGDWSCPKTEGSATTIGVSPTVIARLERLKTLTVTVRAGRAVRHHKVVKSDGPQDLVFQSVLTGAAMNDQNIRNRHLKPAAKALGIEHVNWRALRTSHATWLVSAGADVKSVQAQMRHSRISTTLEIYAQVVPEAQRQAIQKLESYAGKAAPASGPILVQ